MPLPIKTSIVLLLFLAAGAIAGGYGILSDPSGGFLKMSVRDLPSQERPRLCYCPLAVTRMTAT